MNITPSKGYLLIEVEKLPEVVSASGLILSTETNVMLEKGKVIKVPEEGSRYRDDQTVFFKGYDLSTIKIGDKEFNFLLEDSVLGYE